MVCRTGGRPGWWGRDEGRPSSRLMTSSSGIVASSSGGRLALLSFLLFLLTRFSINWEQHVFVFWIAEIELHAERCLSVLAVDLDGRILLGSPKMDELN